MKNLMKYILFIFLLFILLISCNKDENPINSVIKKNDFLELKINYVGKSGDKSIYSIDGRITDYSKYEYAEIWINSKLDTIISDSDFSFTIHINSNFDSTQLNHEIFVKLISEDISPIVSDKIYFTDDKIFPNNLQVLAVYDTAVVLNWNEFSVPDLGYTLEYSKDGKKYIPLLSDSLDKNSSLVPFPLYNGEEYTFRLSAHYGEVSSPHIYSNSISVELPKFHNIRIKSIVDTALVVSWDTMDFPFTSLSLDLLNQDTYEEFDFLLSPGKTSDTLYFPVKLGRYINGENVDSSSYLSKFKASSRYNVIEATKTFKLYIWAPQNLSISEASGSSFKISWDDYNNANKFIVLKSINNSEYELYKEIQNQKFFYETDIDKQNVYRYRVRSYTDHNFSQLSKTIRRAFIPTYENITLLNLPYNLSTEFVYSEDVLLYETVGEIYRIELNSSTILQTYKVKNITDFGVNAVAIGSYDVNTTTNRIALIDFESDSNDYKKFLSIRDYSSGAEIERFQLPKLAPHMNLEFMQEKLMLYGQTQSVGNYRLDIRDIPTYDVIDERSYSLGSIDYNEFYSILIFIDNQRIQFTKAESGKRLKILDQDSRINSYYIDENSDEVFVLTENGTLSKYALPTLNLLEQITLPTDSELVNRYSESKWIIKRNESLFYFDAQFSVLEKISALANVSGACYAKDDNISFLESISGDRINLIQLRKMGLYWKAAIE
ncbi:MAG: fibronectin type III domain-containing protein [Melioribacteraceae bacterium]|nr:fibronectin type III domain-containing protein [Melioribacteraceae bacterium]MCF8263772.1 fibronectin type III domain-containing protein [Melioribacteraceae bacterium]